MTTTFVYFMWKKFLTDFEGNEMDVLTFIATFSMSLIFDISIIIFIVRHW
jgi:hypothetical protein